MTPAMNASARDCEHGQLARSCDRCADAREIEELRAELAAERERWRELLGDVRPWLVCSRESPGTLRDLNALLRRVNEACSLWHERGA